MEQRRSPRTVVRSAARGIVAGIGATAAMSVVMVAAGKLGLMGRHPPSKLGDRLLDRFTSFHSSQKTDLVGAGIHYAIGAALGVGFAILRQAVPPFRLPGSGIVYALGVWTASYAGLLPAFSVMPRPDRDRPGRQPVMIVGHVIFGVVLGLLTRGIVRDRREVTEEP